MSFRKTLDDDEYAAKLLAEDAKKSSLKYAQQGLSALLPRRPTGTAPKPNTRFLKAIVLEADSHNAALKKKEELEARLRQRELNERNRRNTAEIIHENERPRKRRRYSYEEHHRERGRSREDLSHGRLNTGSEQSTSRERRHHRCRRAHDAKPLDVQGKGVHQQDRSRYRSTSFSEPRNADRRDRNRTAQKGRANEKDYKRRRHRSRSAVPANPTDQQRPERASRDHPSTRHFARPERDESEIKRQSTRDTYESDPLEMLVGPLERPEERDFPTEKPPVRSKGRGAYRPSGAAMDAHSSSDYNLGLDLHLQSELEDEKEDWDMALEALHDREMFKQKHAERLREAGFDDVEIKKWEDSGKEKDVADVKWTARGEAREWDLGKEDQDDSFVGTRGNGLGAAGSKKNGSFLKSFKSALR